MVRSLFVRRISLFLPFAVALIEVGRLERLGVDHAVDYVTNKTCGRSR
jgi:hypothetical protein